MVDKSNLKQSEVVFEEPEIKPFGHDIKFFKDVSLEVALEFGRTEITVAELLKWVKGTVIQLDKDKGAALDIYANKNLIAHGEALVVNDNMGCRVTQIIDNDLLDEEL